MALLLALGLFAMLSLAITYAGYRHYARPARFIDNLGVASADASHAARGLEQALLGNPLVRVIQIIGEKVPVSPNEVSVTRRFLIAAGYRSEEAVAVFYGAKIVAAAAFFVAAFFLRDYITIRPVLKILILVAGAGAGYLGANMVLERLVSQRQERLRLSLPDALDLMVVAVEAGIALDQAISIVSRELEFTHQEISEELRLVNLEMQAGKRRADALRNLADRTGEPEIRKLVAILVQTDRFGTSMAESLRTHSDFMRVRRRQQAEERAAKIGVKMIFPIFFFILPTMFVICAGPAIIRIFDELFPLMRGGFK